MNFEQMTPFERRAAFSLAAIFGVRMLGLFMVLPVFALYADRLDGATPALIGLAIGIYGLSQALLQIPFGMASDRLGRKPVIAFGLLVFAAGSALAALSSSIEGMIAGRALQGAGAVAAAVMALAADLTREEHRTKAMAVIGMSIGMSFLAAMIAGPLFGAWLGLHGLFWMIAAMALLGIAILYLAVPTPRHCRHHSDAEPLPGQFARVLRDTQLLRLDAGIFVLHMTLTAMFVAMPLMLVDAGLAGSDHWRLYLPVMLLAMAAAVPFIIVAEKRGAMKAVFLGAIAMIGASLAAMGLWHGSLWALGGLLWLFFAAFNLLEATLPSMISKLAPLEAKGTAMGVYSSSQFAGAFVGGWLGGWGYGEYGVEGLFSGLLLLLALWWLLASGMRRPPRLSSRQIYLGELDQARAESLERELMALAGVAEVRVIVSESVAYLRVDGTRVDDQALLRYSAAAD